MNQFEFQYKEKNDWRSPWKTITTNDLKNYLCKDSNNNNLKITEVDVQADSIIDDNDIPAFLRKRD